jgi:hypothetical protein
MHTMTPWAERWEASIESDLLFDGEELEIEFDFANLMRGDAASRSSYYQSGIQNGWLTRNEARIAENLNPLTGLDEPLRPLNMVEEGAAEDLGIDAEPDVAEPVDETAARFHALVSSTAARWARRISRAGAVNEKDIAQIAEALAVPAARVHEWAHTKACAPMSEAELTESLMTLGMTL